MGNIPVANNLKKTGSWSRIIFYKTPAQYKAYRCGTGGPNPSSCPHKQDAKIFTETKTESN
jgi:hypothetical protein